MDAALPGMGTLINTVAVAIGALTGMTAGHRLPERTRSVVTDCLGLVTILMAVLTTAIITDAGFTAAARPLSPVLIVLAALLLGGITGSLLRIEHHLESLAGRVHSWLGRRAGGPAAPGATRAGEAPGADPARESPACQDPAADAAGARRRFIDGWLTTTLLFCVGPLTILGSLADGMGAGYEQLAVKSVLDAFAAVAFAATYGPGVLASAGSVLLVQGSLTILGATLGATMPAGQIAALTATGGLILGALGLRLLRIREIPVGDLLPALVAAPVLIWVVSLLP